MRGIDRWIDRWMVVRKKERRKDFSFAFGVVGEEEVVLYRLVRSTHSCR